MIYFVQEMQCNKGSLRLCFTVQGTLSFRNVDRIHRSREAEAGKGQCRLPRATPLQLKAESARAGCPGYCL